jgi:hypothetical protein
MMHCLPGGRVSHLGNAELKQVACLLNTDISGVAPDANQKTKRMLSAKYHVGQPVFAGDARHPAVLRVALGAALVWQVALSSALGNDFEARLYWLDEQVGGMLAKLDWINARLLSSPPRCIDGRGSLPRLPPNDGLAFL